MTSNQRRKNRKLARAATANQAQPSPIVGMILQQIDARLDQIFGVPKISRDVLVKALSSKN